MDCISGFEASPVDQTSSPNGTGVGVSTIRLVGAYQLTFSLLAYFQDALIGSEIPYVSIDVTKIRTFSTYST